MEMLLVHSFGVRRKQRDADEVELCDSTAIMDMNESNLCHPPPT